MISRLEIKGFKSLVDVSIELGAVNVFIGANGSGKSNLLEAVGVLSAIVSGSLEAESIRYRGVRLGTPLSFCSSFKNQNQQPISLNLSIGKVGYSAAFEPDNINPKQWRIIEESGSIGGLKFFERSHERLSILSMSDPSFEAESETMRNRSYASFAVKLFPITVKANARMGKASDLAFVNPDTVGIFLNQISQFAIYSPSTPQLRGFLDDILHEPLGLGGSGLGQAIDEMMRIDPDRLGSFDIDDVYELIDWAESLETNSLNIAGQEQGNASLPIRLRIGDRFMGEGHKTVSLLEASEGALYVLFMLALVGHQESPKIFAVDNFDQALHPRLACALTRLVSDQIIEDGSRQMLATTHNPLVLDGLDLLDDRVRLFTVDRDEKGASRVERVLVTEELIEKGFSLSRLWTSGRLGGVPRAI